MNDILFSSKPDYMKAAGILLLGALCTVSFCVFLFYPSEPLLNITPIRRLLTRFPEHRETAVAILTALGIIAVLISFFLIDMFVRTLCSWRSINGALVVTPKAVKIPASFMTQGLTIPIEHIISAKMTEHTIELAYNSVFGRKVVEISRTFYGGLDDFIPIIEARITPKSKSTEELFSISFNKAGLSELEVSEKISALSTLLNKPASEIRAAFKGELFPIRKGLVKDQAAKIIMQLKARGLPVSVSRSSERPAPEVKSQLPGKLITIVPASIAAVFSIAIPGGMTLWVLVMWLALNQSPVKIKLNPLLILATITLECFVNTMPQEAPASISSTVIWAIALSGISTTMRNDIAKTYGATPNWLLTWLFPIIYVTYFANKLLIKDSKAEGALVNESASVKI